MNEITKNDKIDGVLTEFFSAELPQPWPTCRVSGSDSRATSRPRVLAAARWALAASLVLYFVGYFALGGVFPRQLPQPAVDHRRDIGKGFNVRPGGMPPARR